MTVIRRLAVSCALIMLPLWVQAAEMPDWIAMPKYDCRTCHTIDTKLIGPAFKDVAARYKGVAGAKETLKNKVKTGGAGNWNDVTGGVPMTPHPGLTDEELDKVISFVLSLAD